MKKVLVVGYARSGKYVALLLHKEGYAVTITDIRAIDDKAELLKAGIMVFDEGHPWQLASGDWDFIVKNPGIPYHMPFIQELLKHRQIILTEIEVAARFVSRYEYAAITGTNGKTTITTLLHELLRAEFAHSYAAGNIGIPLSDRKSVV